MLEIPALIVGILLGPAEAAAPSVTAGAATTATATADGAPVVIVNSEALSRGEYKEYLLRTFGVDALESFIVEKLAADRAKKEGVLVTDKDVEAWIDDKIRQVEMSPDYQGLDLAETRKKYRPFARSMCLIERLVRHGRASPEGVLREYELRHGEKRQARHILIRCEDGAASPAAAEAKKKADEAYEAVKKGGDFAELARKESQDPGSAENGGKLPGEFSKLDVVPEFAKVAFGLKEGEIAPPVRSEFGWHVIQVTKIIPAAKPLDEALRKELAGEADKRPVDREEVMRYLSEMRKGATVEKRLE